MLRTNSKKVKERIHKMILSEADYLQSEYDIPEEYTKDIKTISAVIYDIFESEKFYNNDYINRNNVNIYDVFKMWGQGLALSTLFHYYVPGSRAVDVLGDILEETEKERNKYSEADAEELLTKLIYREIENNRR